MPDLDVPNISLADKEDDTIEGPTGLYTVDCLHVSMYLERSIRKWVLRILFYNIKFKSIYLPKY